MPACLECHPGTFQDEEGKTECKNCRPGHHVNASGATECRSCAEGSYVDAIGSPVCYKCEVGTFSEERGSDHCIECSAGTTAERRGLTLCSDCEPGFFAGEVGSGGCEACEPGTFSDEYGMSLCEPCDEGFFSDMQGMTSCRECYSTWIPLTSSSNANACVVDEEALVGLMLIGVAFTVLWLLIPSLFLWRVGIDDVYVESAGGRKRVIIRTRSSHWLSFFSLSQCRKRKPSRTVSPKVINLDRIDSTKTAGTEKSITLENAVHVSVKNRVMVPVEFAQTGHPFLDTRPSNHAQDSWWMNTAAARAVQAAHDLIEKVSALKAEEPCGKKGRPQVQPLTRTHLLLLTADGKPEERVIETSMGYLRIYFPTTLFLVAPLQIPMLVWLLLAFLLVLVPVVTFQFEARFVLVTAGIGLLLALFLALLEWRVTPPTLRHIKLKDHSKELERANPFPQRCERGPQRAVQAGQLWRFFMSFETLIRQQRSMYYVVSNLLMPLTSQKRLSYAELAGSHQVLWFVSHFWGTSFRHFVHSVRKHAESVAPYSRVPWTEPTYWICSFSNNQWEVEAEVGKSWDDSSFFKTLNCSDCLGTAMILDDEAMPLTRAWCLFEVLQTKEIQNKRPDFEGLWLCTSTGVLHEGKAGVDVALHLAKRLSNLRLEDATASVQKDKDMIDHLISQMPGGFEAMNRFVKSNIAEALRHMNTAFKKEFNQIMSSLGEEPTSQASDANVLASTSSWERPEESRFLEEVGHPMQDGGLPCK
ncbi:EGF and pentraxin domain-containing protein 1 (Polydom) [Durusdinium trenchii]|uniref:EGF and pentraxin domain-containing protein 1 (Polydom) n=1 Tax=Durusdinium trenchii TaxID=1381693 RepID=A0ABP0IA45_9DINO